MEIDDVRAKISQDGHGLLHSVGYVVELQVQEDLMAPVFQLPHHVGAGGVEQLHADLDEGPLPAQLIQKRQGLFAAAEIAGDYHVLSHQCAPPMISFRLVMPYFSISRGRSATMSRQA